MTRAAKGDRDGVTGLEKTQHKVPGGTHTVLVSLPSPDKQCKGTGVISLLVPGDRPSEQSQGQGSGDLVTSHS